MLSESEASAFPTAYEKADSSATPQNDILTQSPPEEERYIHSHSSRAGSFAELGHEPLRPVQEELPKVQLRNLPIVLALQGGD